MERDAYQSLLAWKNDSDRKPLVLKGARQVGKTHLLKAFGRQEYQRVGVINFEKESAARDLFDESLDPKILLPKLKLYLDMPIEPHTTLLIFDEIQACTNALNSLKYFCEDAREYHVASAGSLLGIKLARSKGFPVGKVNFLQLFPLSFLEFLRAIHKKRLRDFLVAAPNFVPIAQPFHDQLLTYLRYYFYIGGMPEVVQSYVTHEDLEKVRIIQESILESYSLDFAKYAEDAVDVAKISEVWESIPKQLSKENKKFIYSAIRESARGREYVAAIQWLADANLIYKAHLVQTPKVPLQTYAEDKIFKIYLNDVGLLSAMNQAAAKNLLDNQAIFQEFNGSLTENYVAQELKAAGQKRVFYWTSPGRAELDFIAEYDDEIYPLEVKSGTSKRKKSLLIYLEKYHPRMGVRTSTRNYRCDGNIANIPLYLISKYPGGVDTIQPRPVNVESTD